MSLSPTLKRGHAALKLVCGEYMSSTIVVFYLQFEFEIELIILYTVFDPPVCSGSAEFLRVLYYYMAQSLRDGVTLAGRVCGQAYALDRNEDSF